MINYFWCAKFKEAQQTNPLTVSLLESVKTFSHYLDPKLCEKQTNLTLFSVSKHLKKQI